MLTTFVTGIEQHLESQAYSEERLAAVGPIPNQGDQVSTFEFGDRVPECAYAGQNQVGRAGKRFRIAADHRLSTHAFNGFLNASKISHLVIDDPNDWFHEFQFDFWSET
jgi:predicted YcjX-like family ATPase